MRRLGRESAAANLIPEKDYPKTGYCAAIELLRPNLIGRRAMVISASQMRYIKLGAAGRWEKASLESGKLNFGFQDAPHELSMSGDFSRIRQYLIDQGRAQRSATRDTREILDFYGLDQNCLWITFAREHMWWCFAQPEVEWVGGDGSSHGERTRTAIAGWSNKDINGVPLKMSSLSTQLTKVAGYRRTICNIEAEQYLLRRINGIEEPILVTSREARASMLAATGEAIRLLHWRDFETLVDLIFVRSGWNRISALGGTQKLIDLELEQPLTNERIVIQVKSEADQRTFDEYIKASDEAVEDRKFFFICHSPKGNLIAPASRTNIYLWTGEKLADAVFRTGLNDWVIERILQD